MGRFHRIFYHLFVFHMSEQLTLFFMLTIIPFVFSEDNTFKKKRPLINSTNLNKLLRSPIYPHLDGQHILFSDILLHTRVFRPQEGLLQRITHCFPILTFDQKDTFCPHQKELGERKVKGTAILHLLLPQMILGLQLLSLLWLIVHNVGGEGKRATLPSKVLHLSIRHPWFRLLFL